MNTAIIEHVFDGVVLKAPTDIEWPCDTFDKFACYCGPGKGYLETIVADKILGLNISPACFIHDTTHALLPKTLKNFWLSNKTFLWNMESINQKFSSTKAEQYTRTAAIKAYYFGVASPIGYLYFLGSKI